MGKMHTLWVKAKKEAAIDQIKFKSDYGKSLDSFESKWKSALSAMEAAIGEAKTCFQISAEYDKAMLAAKLPIKQLGPAQTALMRNDSEIETTIHHFGDLMSKWKGA